MAAMNRKDGLVGPDLRDGCLQKLAAKSKHEAMIRINRTGQALRKCLHCRHNLHDRLRPGFEDWLSEEGRARMECDVEVVVIGLGLVSLIFFLFAVVRPASPIKAHSAPVIAYAHVQKREMRSYIEVRRGNRFCIVMMPDTIIQALIEQRREAGKPDEYPKRCR